jgi:hypothetical protein
MDGLNITAPLDGQEKTDFRTWLRGNGRIADDSEGVKDICLTGADDVSLWGKSGLEGSNLNRTILRDVENKRVEFALLTIGEPSRIERTSIQLKHEPTPFPFSLRKWLVSI